MHYIFNLNNNHLIDANGARIATKPQLTFSTAPDWTIQLCEVNSGVVTPLDLSNALSWRAAVDRDHDTQTEPMCRTLNDGIDQSEAAAGKITVKLNADTETFHAAINGKATLAAWFELWGLDSTGTAIYYLKIPIVALMPIDPTSGEVPPAPAEQWADRAWVESLLRAGFELQYSADESDPSDWTATAETAQWYRFRNREIGGLWSDPLEMSKGEKGDNAPEVIYQYSADASTWNAVYTDGDLYCRISTDGGGTWSPAIRIKGDSGGGSGGAYYAGYGINITDNSIAVDETVVAMKEDLNHLALSGLSDVSDLSGAQDGQSLLYNAFSAKWQPGDVSGGGGGGSVNVYPAVATADAVTDENTGIATVKVRKVKITASGTEYDGIEQTLICGWPAPTEGA